MGDANVSAREPNQSWFGAEIQRREGAIEKPTNEAKVIEILTNKDRYPSPVRPVGSRHSMTECISARAPGDPEKWGTLVDMSEFVTLHDGTGAPDTNTLRVIPDPDATKGQGTVTVPAGRTFISVARELREKGWVFRVNTELGTLTMGAAACGATKDSSFPGESGQVCADVVGMRIVKPDGEVKDFKENAPELDALRCSYGLFGIVTEVTFRVYRFEYISLEHKGPVNLQLDDGLEASVAILRGQFADWLSGDSRAVFLYMFPFRDRIVAELREKPARGGGEMEEKSARLQIRNYFWEKGSEAWQRVSTTVGIRALKHTLQNAFDILLKESLGTVFKECQVNPVAQIVDFDKEDSKHRFTFSMWAFPEENFAEILPLYFKLCWDHEETYRSCLPHVSYHIAQDRSSLLSYSYYGNVWTLDPICPYDERMAAGWRTFLLKFNDFSRDHGGVPLLNQTPFLERRHVKDAFGDRLSKFEAKRRQFDPDGRMLNDYFAKLLAS
jgi:FAD/FMN-containing dehydrogenase